MDAAKLFTNSKSDGATKTDQTSAHAKAAATHRRINVQMVQNVHLIWLDNNIDENDADCRNTIMQLQHVVNTINTFTDGDQCIQFLDDMVNNKSCMIISGSLGQHIVPCIHNMSQVESIFIFCGNKKRHKRWAKDWPKIKGIFTEIVPICEALKQAPQQCEQNAIPISFVTTSGDISKTNLDQLEPSFMYTQILKEIFLTIGFEEKHIKEFIEYCPIWWYTFECLLYPMLYRALRVMDVDIIIKMGFFIVDLYRHIQQLQSEQFDNDHSSNSFTVYHGQGMDKKDFEKVTKTKGELISFNNFLSTSKNHDVSLLFAESNQSNPDLIGILFVMTIDSSLLPTPFASTNSISHFQVEDGVLFWVHIVFCICDITPMGENHHLFWVELTLTSDNSQDLRVLTDRICEETFPNAEGWYRLDSVLLQISQSKQIQQVYEILLEQATTNRGKAHIYPQLGMAKCNQGEYQEAIIFYEK